MGGELNFLAIFSNTNFEEILYAILRVFSLILRYFIPIKRQNNRNWLFVNYVKFVLITLSIINKLASSSF